MTAPDGLRTPWFVLAICCLFLVLLPVALVRHWKSTAQPYDVPLSGIFSRSTNLRKGHVRALPVLFGWGMVLCLTMVLMFIAPDHPAGAANPYYSWGLVTIFASTLLSIILYWLVVLINKPKFIVAPHLRGEPGFLTSRRADPPPPAHAA